MSDIFQIISDIFLRAKNRPAHFNNKNRHVRPGKNKTLFGRRQKRRTGSRHVRLYSTFLRPAQPHAVVRNRQTLAAKGNKLAGKIQASPHSRRSYRHGGLRHPCSQKVTPRKPYGYRHLRRNARNRAEKSGRKRLVRHYLIQQRRLHEPAFCRRHIRRRNCGIRRKEF